MARLLQQLFRRQAMQVASLVTLDGDVPELAGWVKVTAEAAKPLLLRMTQHGIVETQVRIARKLGKVPESVGATAGDGMRRYAVPASEVFGKSWRVRKAADAKVRFDLFNPRV
ncbi:MAG: hypothetical protein KGL39_20660, partial [Patescibacteria group bacterium]|nr:hypothetical protein [Patescibacteria group bacterium]